MKDQDKKSGKADKKEKKEKGGGKTPDKKLAKAVAKQVKKDLEKKLEKAVKQIRKETKQALEEVLDQALDRLDTDTKRVIREALASSFAGPASRNRDRSPDDTDQEYENSGVEEVTLDMEPDELHMGDEIPVVEVDAAGDSSVTATDTGDADEKPKRGGKKAKEAPAADPKNKGGQPNPPANPRKRGTAEAEIGSRTEATASPTADPDDPDA